MNEVNSSVNHWNYRFLRTPDGDGFVDILIECYYRDGKPWAYCERTPCINSKKELKEFKALLTEAFEKPRLYASDFPGGS